MIKNKYVSFSDKWKHRVSVNDLVRCLNCYKMHGKIYAMEEFVFDPPPSQPGRIWYEADINYESGRRNSERIVYSNDGLIFVTYDHYHTFVEIK